MSIGEIIEIIKEKIEEIAKKEVGVPKEALIEPSFNPWNAWVETEDFREFRTGLFLDYIETKIKLLDELNKFLEEEIKKYKKMKEELDKEWDFKFS